MVQVYGGMYTIDNDMQTIREELDDHLLSINENTQELEAQYSHMKAMDKRLKSLEEQFAKINDVLAKLMPNEMKQQQEQEKITVTAQEEKVFTALYQADSLVSYDDLTSVCDRSLSFVRSTMNRLIEKGIPVVQETVKRKTMFMLEPKFKEQQVKYGIVAIERALTLDAFDQRIAE